MSRAVFPATKEALPDILSWIQSETDSHLMQLVAEEVVVNIIEHADAQEMTIICDESLTFIDTGVPFNPLEKASTLDPSLSLEEREPGGLGIDIIRRYTRSAEYRRDGKTNVLVLKFS